MTKLKEGLGVRAARECAEKISTADDELGRIAHALKSAERDLAAIGKPPETPPALRAAVEDLAARLAVGQAVEADLRTAEKALAEAEGKAATWQREAVPQKRRLEAAIKGLTRRREELAAEREGLIGENLEAVREAIREQAEAVFGEYSQEAGALAASFRRLLALDSLVKSTQRSPVEYVPALIDTADLFVPAPSGGPRAALYDKTDFQDRSEGVKTETAALEAAGVRLGLIPPYNIELAR